MRPMCTMLNRAVMITRHTPSSTPMRTLTGNSRYVNRNRLPLLKMGEDALPDVIGCNYRWAKLYVNTRDDTRQQTRWITCCWGLECLLFFWWNKTCWWCVESTQPRESSARRAWKNENQQWICSEANRQKETQPEVLAVQHPQILSTLTNTHLWIWAVWVKPSKTKWTGDFPACERWGVMSKRCDDAHHMLHSIWKRIRFCPCRTGMIMRKTATRRQRKNTRVWRIMPARRRSETPCPASNKLMYHTCSSLASQGWEGWARILLLETQEHNLWSFLSWLTSKSLTNLPLSLLKRCILNHKRTRWALFEWKIWLMICGLCGNVSVYHCHHLIFSVQSGGTSIKYLTNLEH